MIAMLRKIFSRMQPYRKNVLDGTRTNSLFLGRFWLFAGLAGIAIITLAFGLLLVWMATSIMLTSSDVGLLRLIIFAATGVLLFVFAAGVLRYTLRAYFRWTRPPEAFPTSPIVKAHVLYPPGYRSPHRKKAVLLATSLYDSIKDYLEAENDIDTKNDHGPFHIAGFNIRIRYYGESSRGLFWEHAGVRYRMWFEVRGWVHFDRGNERIYQQVLFTELPSPGNRPDEFKGDMSHFFSVGERLLEHLEKTSRLGSSLYFLRIRNTFFTNCYSIPPTH